MQWDVTCFLIFCMFYSCQPNEADSYDTGTSKKQFVPGFPPVNLLTNLSGTSKPNRPYLNKYDSFRSRATYIAMLLVISGDIEMNPGHKGQKNLCGMCSKLVRKNDRAVKCNDCENWIHTRCANITVAQYEEMKTSKENWYCPKCVSPCGICSENVHNWDPAIECEKCLSWFHNSCSHVTSPEYKKIQTTNCVWICPNCENSNFSTSFSSTSSSSIVDENPFEVLDPQPSRKNNKPKICKPNTLKFVSININGIRGKKTRPSRVFVFRKSRCSGTTGNQNRQIHN